MSLIVSGKTALKSGNKSKVNWLDVHLCASNYDCAVFTCLMWALFAFCPLKYTKGLQHITRRCAVKFHRTLQCYVRRMIKYEGESNENLKFF